MLSVVYEKTAGDLVFRCGSLLIGPPGIAAGWPAWRLAEGHKPEPREQELNVPPSFVVDLEHAVAGRTPIAPADARAWLRAALEEGHCLPHGGLPAARAGLGIARAPIRVSTESQTHAGDLATWLARPVTGFHFPRNDDPADISAGESWTVHGATLFTPAVDLLGISWFDSKTGPPPCGLLVGRLERRAWLAGQRLLPEDDLYRVTIGIDPERADLADLELEVEERVGDELVLAERLRLEDTDLSEPYRALYGRQPDQGRVEVGVGLPTLGRAVRRAVRLHHRDGALLDEWQLFNIVESIGLTLVVNGGRQPTTWSGERRPAPQLVELLGAVERVRRQYAELRRGGAATRLFDDPAEGRAALRALLLHAPGELVVLDPWLRDWDLLTGLRGPPPRILIGGGVPPPPPDFPGRVARWRHGPAPFHDRFFLWEGGGVSVGTSIGSVAARMYRIARLAAAEVDVLRERFALWWSDPGFERLS